MKAWLLVSVPNEQRTYGGNIGYRDDATRVYQYDSNVPNSAGPAVGDLAIIRDHQSILGSAFIEKITSSEGVKSLQRCPACRATKLKRRRKETPLYRCECGATFDTPAADQLPCRVHEADFGDTFSPLARSVSKQQIWDAAVRLNKQFSILELDVVRTVSQITAPMARLPYIEEFPLSPQGRRMEGALRRVYVNRYERDRGARGDCLAHYGCRCSVCGIDFGSRYGAIAEGTIHVHHLVPLCIISQEYIVDPIRDLRPVCPNCHVVIHLRVPPYSIEETKGMLQL